MKPPMPLAILMLPLLACPGCGDNPDDEANRDAVETEVDVSRMGSYAIGWNVAAALVEEALPLDHEMLMDGVRDALEDRAPRFPEDQLGEALAAFQEQAETEWMREEAEWNLEHSQAFLESNGSRDGVETTESGLQYEIIVPGDGPTPTEADTVVVHYRGVTADGMEFDSSYRHGAPSVFAVEDVIEGWAEALTMMNVGALWRLYVPPSLAYGEEGAGPVGPNEVLVFGIELVSIVDEEPLDSEP